MLWDRRHATLDQDPRYGRYLIYLVSSYLLHVCLVLPENISMSSSCVQDTQSPQSPWGIKLTPLGHKTGQTSDQTLYVVQFDGIYY